MKHMKKLVGLLLTMVMVMAMSITTFATDITISDDDANGSTYVAYKLLNATNAVDEKEEATDKFAYTLNNKYEAVLKEVTKKEAEADIIEYISKLSDDDVQTFADSIYAKVKSMGVDVTATNKTFSNVNQGYYLIAETATAGHPDTMSLVMLDTAGQDSIYVTTKEDSPKVEKKVRDKNDTTGVISGWQDSADYDIGDEIPYQITGTVSDKIANYKEYYYSFTDKMTHLTYKDNSVKVMIGESDVTSQFATNWKADTKTLTVTCKDLKKLTGATVNANSKIVVTYTATLDADANIGAAGNPNTVKLTYSNNPYHEGDGTPTNDTPEDKNIVFTFEGIVNKVDGAHHPLKDAEFTLYKFDQEKNEFVEYKNKLTVGGEGDKAGTVFTAKGLDDGKYKIVETKVPAGYNKAADVEFTITATHDETADEPTLLTLTVDNTNVTANKETGTVSTSVVNNSGTELPSTGGMGTTLFYIIGAILVIGAGVVLIARKRMGSDN